MSWKQRAQKCREKLSHYFSPSKNLQRLGFALESRSLAGNEGFYIERAEYGPVNLHTKLQRQALGGPFEPRDITLVNREAVRLAGTPATVLEVGSGTGMFSTLLAHRSPNSQIVASEFQDETREWAMKNRSHPSIEYCKKPFSDFSDNSFELCVALEVIEHISDYPSFLAQVARVAPRAIVSTPNKFRTAHDMALNTPEFDQHVREWSSGEFYWVLRVFWDDVRIFTLPNIQLQMRKLEMNENFQPISKETGVHCREHCMIAICEKPRHNLVQNS
jgi:SAM-dependent methyltransferase